VHRDRQRRSPYREHHRRIASRFPLRRGDADLKIIGECHGRILTEIPPIDPAGTRTKRS